MLIIEAQCELNVEDIAVANFKRGLKLVVVVVVVSCLLMLPGSCHGNLNNHAALFVFGDSFFDPGNNNYINTTTEYQANFWPYGESYFNPPSGRFTNGRTISDFIAEYARLPLIPGYLDPSRTKNDFVYGANFASGGTGVLTETFAGFALSLQTQLQYFGDLEKHFRQNLGHSKTEQLLSDAVYLFSCGANDYANIVYPHTVEYYLEMVIGNLTSVFKGIHEKGGRKFAILNLPNTNCFPRARAKQPGNTCNEEHDIVSSLHNQQLSNKLQELEKKLEGFTYAIFNYNIAISNRMKNPSQYGLKVGDTACCGSGPYRGVYNCGGRGVPEFELCDNVNDYLFFDCAHPTEVVYRQFAEMFWNGDSDVTTPNNLKTLFQGRNTDLLAKCLEI